MKCHEIMTPDPKVCIPEDDVADIATLMWEHDDYDSILFGDLPVVKDLKSKELVGIITYRTLAIHALGHSHEHPSEVKVSHCMSSSFVTCNAEDTVETAAQLMREHRVGRIPVVDENGCCIGTISRANLLSYELHAESGITTGCGLLR